MCNTKRDFVPEICREQNKKAKNIQNSTTMKKNNNGNGTNSRVGRIRFKKHSKEGKNHLLDNFIVGMTNRAIDLNSE